MIRVREYKKESILKYLNEANEPVDIEKIRKACGIGNWATALNYCLTFLAEGRIKGQQTSRGWIFWTHQQTNLQPWEEAIGTYEDLKINENNVTLILTTQKTLNITFSTNSPEAQAIIQTLSNTPKGTKIAILKTDIPEKPLIIRAFNEARVANKADWAFLWLRKRVLWVAFKQFSVCCVEVFVHAV